MEGSKGKKMVGLSNIFDSVNKICIEKLLEYMVRLNGRYTILKSKCKSKGMINARRNEKL